MQKPARKNQIGQRLISNLQQIGLNSAESIKKATGLTQHSLWRYGEGDRGPSLARLSQLAEDVPGLDLHWIITGKSAPLPEVCSSFSMPIISRTGATPAASKNWCQTWLHNINLQPEQGAILIIEEDSWQPLINLGDMVIFDTHNKDLDYAGLFVLNWHNHPILRRVEPGGHGSYILSSSHGNNSLLVEAGELEPLGRMLGVLRGNRL